MAEPGNNYPDYTEELEAVTRAERDYIARRRKAIGLREEDFSQFGENLREAAGSTPETKWQFPGGPVGLALSGGGIRSATFNLGLLQALAKQNILRFCDYLSTVSGGGYIGSCLTSLLDNPAVSVEFSAFPFRFTREVKADERKEVKWLRKHSKYLAPRTGLFSLAVWRMVGLYLSGLVLTNVTTLYLTILLSYVLFLIVHQFPEPQTLPPLLFKVSVGLFGVMILARWAAAQRNLQYPARRFSGTIQAALAMLAATTFVVGGFIWLAVHLPQLKSGTQAFVNDLVNGGAIASALGLVCGLLKSKHNLMQRAIDTLFRLGTIAALPIALALFVRFLWVTDIFEIYGQALLLLCAVLFILSLLTNTNRISFHHFYRDRLSESYIIKRREQDGDEAIVSNEALTLQNMHRQPNGAPYHLINTTVNLPGSKNRYLRGRGADFFFFSKFYVGSQSTGYRRSDLYDNGGTRIATAMAISGAAASPQMGEMSSPVIRFLMTLLNVRLNRFMPNPKRPRKLFPRVWPYYFLKELLGTGNENAWLLNLSDGGHHENLGIYPLIQRRCAVIIASDAAADPDYTFQDLANVIRKVRIDLGVEIRIDLADLRLQPGTRNSKHHIATGTISYPDSPEGLLIYIKTTMTGNESEDLIAYRRNNPTFPDQTTADQFFDEAQFESYRALGYSIGREVLAGA